MQRKLIIAGICIILISLVAGAVVLGKNKSQTNEIQDSNTGIVVPTNTNNIIDNPIITIEPTNTNFNTEPTKQTWNYQNNEWIAPADAPACNTPLLGISPVDIKLATSILYPGQTRGQYKAHGGFLFKNNKTNDVEVRMPMDGYITGATRYYEDIDVKVPELQYMVSFFNDCGVSFKFDHLLKLSPEVQAIMDTRPEAKLNDTSGLPITNGKFFKQGDIIATAIGKQANKNVSVDFGLYDYRQKNIASQNPAYAAAHQNFAAETFYGVCWFNELPAKDAAIAKSLPGGDGKAGKTSDYCK